MDNILAPKSILFQGLCGVEDALLHCGMKIDDARVVTSMLQNGQAAQLGVRLGDVMTAFDDGFDGKTIVTAGMPLASLLRSRARSLVSFGIDFNGGEKSMREPVYIRESDKKQIVGHDVKTQFVALSVPTGSQSARETVIDPTQHTRNNLLKAMSAVLHPKSGYNMASLAAYPLLQPPTPKPKSTQPTEAEDMLLRSMEQSYGFVLEWFPSPSSFLQELDWQQCWYPLHHLVFFTGTYEGFLLFACKNEDNLPKILSWSNGTGAFVSESVVQAEQEHDLPSVVLGKDSELPGGTRVLILEDEGCPRAAHILSTNLYESDAGAFSYALKIDADGSIESSVSSTLLLVHKGCKGSIIKEEANPAKKSKSKQAVAMSDAAVLSNIHMTLSLASTMRIMNPELFPDLCLRIRMVLQDCTPSRNSAMMSSLGEKAFEAVGEFASEVVTSPSAMISEKQCAIALQLSLAMVSEGLANILAVVLKLRAIEEEADGTEMHVQLRESFVQTLAVLSEQSTDECQLPVIGASELSSTFVLNHHEKPQSVTGGIATDGIYLYLRIGKTLVKAGNGVGQTKAGSVYMKTTDLEQIPSATDEHSAVWLACVGEHLYLMSSTVGNGKKIVTKLNTKSMLVEEEIPCPLTALLEASDVAMITDGVFLYFLRQSAPNQIMVYKYSTSFKLCFSCCLKSSCFSLAKTSLRESLICTNGVQIQFHSRRDGKLYSVLCLLLQGESSTATAKTDTRPVQEASVKGLSLEGIVFDPRENCTWGFVSGAIGRWDNPGSAPQATEHITPTAAELPPPSAESILCELGRLAKPYSSSRKLRVCSPASEQPTSVFFPYCVETSADTFASLITLVSERSIHFSDDASATDRRVLMSVLHLLEANLNQMLLLTNGDENLFPNFICLDLRKQIETVLTGLLRSGPINDQALELAAIAAFAIAVPVFSVDDVQCCTQLVGLLEVEDPSKHERIVLLKLLARVKESKSMRAALVRGPFCRPLLTCLIDKCGRNSLEQLQHLTTDAEQGKAVDATQVQAFAIGLRGTWDLMAAHAIVNWSLAGNRGAYDSSLVDLCSFCLELLRDPVSALIAASSVKENTPARNPEIDRILQCSVIGDLLPAVLGTLAFCLESNASITIPCAQNVMAFDFSKIAKVDSVSKMMESKHPDEPTKHISGDADWLVAIDTVIAGLTQKVVTSLFSSPQFTPTEVETSISLDDDPFLAGRHTLTHHSEQQGQREQQQLGFLDDLVENEPGSAGHKLNGAMFRAIRLYIRQQGE
jgi:hypothetical protein